MDKPQLEKFLSWYRDNHRPFPWRQTKDPYTILVSEIMLQQTTSQAVIPYFERFLKQFPTVKALAESPQELVLQNWSGLGYYSRARNLHLCAQKIHQLGRFPRDWQSLIALPGIGPYTARAISSFAFGEIVGVLDGNVIRFVSRYLGLSVEWWRPAVRQQLQDQVDQWARTIEDAELNQALIEIGSTICLPQTPKCLICPVAKNCKSKNLKDYSPFPLAKPKRAKEIWYWHPQVHFDKNKGWLLCKDENLPFLKDQWMFPGECKMIKTTQKVSTKKPGQKFDCKHFITHHEIRVKVTSHKVKPKQIHSGRSWKWVQTKDLKKTNPSSLLQKVIHYYKA